MEKNLQVHFPILMIICPVLGYNSMVLGLIIRKLVVTQLKLQHADSIKMQKRIDIKKSIILFN